MDFESLFDIPIDDLHTPCYLTDARLLQKNTALLKQIQQRTGCKILLAQKAFSMFSAYPLIRDDLAGTTASGLFEAKLGREHFGKEVHVFSPAYTQEDFKQLLELCDHIVFNSFGQWKKYRQQVQDATRNISCGIRINPGYAEVETDLYNPCISGSRMGVPLEQMEDDFAGLDGIHFHTMCEQNSDVLERTLDHMLPQFDKWLKRCKWVNFGGGHHITRPGYDLAALEACIARMQEKYGVQVYLEPGEAWALNAGYLVTTVLDTLQNGDTSLAVLDMSAACHTPDVIEMPYRPPLLDAGEPGEKPCTIRLGGPTCLAGDVVGDYSFDAPLAEGDRLIFGDMAIYTTCKNNTFNGMPLPPIWALAEDGTCRELVRFGYNDFKMRLGHRA